MIGVLFVIGLLVYAWSWLKKEAPGATGTAATIAKGTWAVTKGTVRLTHRAMIAGAGLYQATREKVVCPHCTTEIPMIGVVTCTRCGYPERRRFMTTCGHCGAPGPGYVVCPACHLGVRYPLAWLQPKGTWSGGAPPQRSRGGKRGRRS